MLKSLEKFTVVTLAAATFLVLSTALIQMAA
jgi:hypothetical protein